VLSTPREVRNVLVYVLNNVKKHLREIGEGLAALSRWVDPCSSAAYFDGWKAECIDWIPPPDRSQAEPPAMPRLWLTRTGWKRHGLLHTDELPR
jgi:hypothetical protein